MMMRTWMYQTAASVIVCWVELSFEHGEHGQVQLQLTRNLNETELSWNDETAAAETGRDDAIT